MTCGSISPRAWPIFADWSTRCARRCSTSWAWVAAVEQICRRSALPVDMDLPTEIPDLPAAVEITAYRIIAEAITNAARHAGASRCTVRMTATRRLVLDIYDDGPSQAPWQPGVGLTSMRERTADLGGSWSAGPRPAGGGHVHAELPLTLTGVTS